MLVFNFAGGFWAASLVRERERRFGLALLLLNFAYLYNTLIWEQVDAIYTCFAFGAVVLAGQRRSLVGSVLCFVLALLTKPRLSSSCHRCCSGRPRDGTAGRGSSGGRPAGRGLLAPFIWSGEQNYLFRIIAIYSHITNVYPVVSQNTFNFWHLTSANLRVEAQSDLLLVAGLPYRAWGCCSLPAVRR